MVKYAHIHQRGLDVAKFSKTSFERLSTCDIRLVELFSEVVKHFDCSVLEGRRDKDTQEYYFKTGKSKLRWSNSKHNALVEDKSKAVDVVPYPVDWSYEKEIINHLTYGYKAGHDFSRAMKVVHNIERWFKFGGFVLGMAQKMEIPLVWGGDWDGDHQMSDQRFDDLPHFELAD